MGAGRGSSGKSTPEAGEWKEQERVPGPYLSCRRAVFPPEAPGEGLSLAFLALWPQLSSFQGQHLQI